MRIGEIAALVGVTPRAVRHYHHQGLLPEPARQANGYRDYSVRDAVLLARIRRLTELGLGLDEVRDILADDAGRELVEVLEELDEDLARQQERLAERRARLGALLASARDGRLTAEGPVSAELAALFGTIAEAGAGRPGPESPMAARDREMLALLDTVAPAGERERLLGAMRRMTEAPGAADRAHEVYALLDALADEATGADDPRVEEAARALATCIPDEVAQGLGTGGTLPDSTFRDAFFADFSPAQAAAVRRALRIVAERAR
ncbi:MerR family transcriptional regulator [Streptomyces sp. FIT100]|uniref:MerR family transcriptional regulator n=1 Tax=Streptomyces sp. FIT100 TaxID=2837956 RepID=UPI0021C723FB|nr:MerR family transcriptional regulator [Streptomyces sp. FIT100]UUN26606.1 MerR family transcriptional regulator [Streptomyces sp. FIT100]